MKTGHHHHLVSIVVIELYHQLPENDDDDDQGTFTLKKIFNPYQIGLRDGLCHETKRQTDRHSWLN